MNGIGEIIREPRASLDGPVTYEYGEGERGLARWSNVSRTGAGMRLGRYLRPGTPVRMTFASPVASGGVALMEARVIWCRQAQAGIEFEAGLKALRRNADAALAFSALGHQARKERDARSVPMNNASQQTVLQVWTGFDSKPDERYEAPDGDRAKAV